MTAVETSSSMPITRAGAVAAELRRMIQSGELEAGTHLRQVEVAKRFDVSTTPVREAFATLARDGLVRQDSHRGVVVFLPSVDELVEIYDIRGVLEPLATRLASERLTAEQLAELASIVAQMRDADAEHYSDLNRKFHSRIYSAAGRPRLAEMIRSLRGASDAYLRMTVVHHDAAYLEQVHKEHEAILDALTNGTPKEAARRLGEHLRHNERHVAALIETPSTPQ